MWTTGLLVPKSFEYTGNLFNRVTRGGTGERWDVLWFPDDGIQTKAQAHVK